MGEVWATLSYMCAYVVARTQEPCMLTEPVVGQMSSHGSACTHVA